MSEKKLSSEELLAWAKRLYKEVKEITKQIDNRSIRLDELEQGNEEFKKHFQKFEEQFKEKQSNFIIPIDELEEMAKEWKKHEPEELKKWIEVLFMENDRLEGRFKRIQKVSEELHKLRIADYIPSCKECRLTWLNRYHTFKELDERLKKETTI